MSLAGFGAAPQSFTFCLNKSFQKISGGCCGMANRVLVVDDERLIVKGLRLSLEQDDMEVSVAYDGEEALSLARGNDFSLIILDVMLPKLSGLEVCQQIREFSTVPIIMLTAKGDDMDKIMGLEFGADDYITKPFNILVLKARVKALLRRSIRKTAVPEKRKICVRDLEIDPEARQVTIRGDEVSLTAREFDLLELLMQTGGKVHSRESLLTEIWGADYPGDARTVDVHVRRLREKIEENPSNPKYILTKWGVGYYFHT
jgi:DNA-binding response OmpR family regulator